MNVPAHFRRAYRYGAYRFWLHKLKHRLPHPNSEQEPTTVVDCGCGAGYLLPYLRNWFPGLRVIGIDINERELAAAASRSLERSGVHLIEASVNALPLTSGSATLMIGFHLVEHLPEPRLFLEETYRTLRPEGLLVLATPNLGSVGARVMKARWRGHRDPTHMSLKTSTEWRFLVEDSGFRIISYGTTSLGVPILRQLTWVLLFFLGFLRWDLGESFVCIAQKGAGRSAPRGGGAS